MFIATLQIKMNDQIKQIEDHINEDKRKAIEEEIKRDTQPAPKSKSKKS